MSREVHVRFCEGLGLQRPGLLTFDITQCHDRTVPKLSQRSGVYHLRRAALTDPSDQLLQRRRSKRLDWLNKALQGRSHWLVWLNRDPRWEGIRSDPRFADLAKRVGLPEADQ